MNNKDFDNNRPANNSPANKNPGNKGLTGKHINKPSVSKEKNTKRDIPEPLLIVDEDTGLRFYGGDQAWFKRNTMTFAGCGVVAAANTMRALLCKYPEAYNSARGNLKVLGNVIITKAEFISVINDMYKKMFVAELPLANLIYDNGDFPYGSRLLKYIPPSFGMSAASVVRGLLKYANTNGLLIHDVYLSASYIDFERGLSFIKEGLKKNGAVILLTSFNKHPLTLYSGKAGDTSHSISVSSMKTHFATITDILQEKGEPVIKLSTWGRVATIPYKTLHETWQKRSSYVSALIYFVPERSKAMYRADLRKASSFTPVCTLQTIVGRRLPGF